MALLTVGGLTFCSKANATDFLATSALHSGLWKDDNINKSLSVWEFGKQYYEETEDYQPIGSTLRVTRWLLHESKIYQLTHTIATRKRHTNIQEILPESTVKMLLGFVTPNPSREVEASQ